MRKFDLSKWQYNARRRIWRCCKGPARRSRSRQYGEVVWVRLCQSGTFPCGVEEKDRTNKSNKHIMPTVAKGSRHCPGKRKRWKQDIKGWAGEWAAWAKSFRSALPPIHNHPAGKYSRLTGRGREHCSAVTGMGTDSWCKCHWFFQNTCGFPRKVI